METEVRYVPTLPSAPTHKVVDGEAKRVWADVNNGYVVLKQFATVAPSFHPAVEASIFDVMQKHGWSPLGIPAEDEDGNPVDMPDQFHLEWGRVWRYWLTVPDVHLPGVRSFVAAAESGGLPPEWGEKTAEDGDGVFHTICLFTLTMNGARSLGAEQKALTTLANLPNGVYFFQTVARIDGFGGLEKESRQPTTIPAQPYVPGDLFQTNHPDSGDQRATTFGESDVLSATGLTLT